MSQGQIDIKHIQTANRYIPSMQAKITSYDYSKTIEQDILDTNAGKQLSQAATDV